jgi:hypothetical protein
MSEQFDWTPAAIAHLTGLRAKGLSVARAAADMGVSKSTASGKLHRLKMGAASSSTSTPLSAARRTILARDWPKGVHALTVLGRLNNEPGHKLTSADMFAAAVDLPRPDTYAADDRALRSPSMLPAPKTLSEQYRDWCKSRGVDAHQFAVDFVSATQQVSA